MIRNNKLMKINRRHKEKKRSSNISKGSNVKPYKESFIIASIYGMFGLLWITLSDHILSLFIDSLTLYKQFQTYKGWVYIFITIGLVYSLVYKRSSMVRDAMIKMSYAYEELQTTYEELVATEADLMDQKRFNEQIFTDAKVIIGTWDEQGRLTSLNPYGQNLFGYTESEVLGGKWLDLFIQEDNKANMINNFKRIKQGQQQPNHESQFVSKDNKKLDIIWNNSLLYYQNKTSEVLSIGTDITTRKKLEEQLKEIAYYDVLTGLPNRILIEDEVNKLIDRNELFVMIHMDLDNFKQINETLGHTIGDLFLQYISKKLSEIIISPNRVARLGGDEFAIILMQPIMKDEIEKELISVIKDLGKSWEVNQYEFFISSSMGIAIFPKDGKDYSTLFKNADVAMYQAKKEGKSRCIFYSEELLKDNIDNLKLANQLQYAIKNRELTLYYQPQFSLSSGKITGVEALVRWIHPEMGFIPPDKFIPIAEETGQIYEIEKWIINTALHQKALFEQDGREDIDISINLSSKALASEMNFYAVEKLFSSYDIDYTHITIEITETAIISDIGTAVDRLKKLKKLGMKIALDDFGTGYSSLIHLKELPIDIVKLDRSFIKGIEGDSKNAMIIKAILYLTKDLNYEVVAEGIESIEQLEYLIKYKCQTGQGYLMSRPITIEDLCEKLEFGFEWKL